MKKVDVQGPEDLGKRRESGRSTSRVRGEIALVFLHSSLTGSNYCLARTRRGQKSELRVATSTMTVTWTLAYASPTADLSQDPLSVQHLIVLLWVQARRTHGSPSLVMGK